MGYFGEGVCRPSDGELMPVPKDGEVVIFRDFFTTGLRFPLDPTSPKLLEPHNVELHHLTPNAIVQMSKFLWAVQTFFTNRKLSVKFHGTCFGDGGETKDMLIPNHVLKSLGPFGGQDTASIRTSAMHKPWRLNAHEYARRCDQIRWILLPPWLKTMRR